MIFVRRGATLNDPTNKNDVETLLANGQAGRIENVKAGWDDPEPVRVESPYACEPQAAPIKNWSGTIMDGKITENNIDFWDSADAVNGASFGAFIMYSCNNGVQYYVEANILLFGGWVNPMTDEELQMFNINMEWRSKTSPQLQVANPIFLTPSA